VARSAGGVDDEEEEEEEEEEEGAREPNPSPGVCPLVLPTERARARWDAM
jgi:hypothetical protein